MKKLLTLVVAGCMVLSSLGAASAVDVKVNGQFWFWYGYYSNTLLVEKSDSGKHSDRVRARQRARVQIQFIADENLSALLNLENNMHWGDSSKKTGVNQTNGALDSDNSTFFVKRAHLDWTIPNTQVKTRMGMQGIAMPSVTFGNPVMNADVAGISVSNQFTPELGLTAFWARPYDRAYYDAEQQGGENDMDEMDLFGFMLPIKTDVVRFTPWGMIALIGKDSGFWDNGYSYNRGQRAPNAAVRGDFDSTATAWWVGTTFELPILDPFFVKLDAMYGSLDTGDNDYDTAGWMVAGDIGYKFSWGSLSAVGFYSTGDKDDDDLGQMPIVSLDGEFAIGGYGLGGHDWRRHDSLLSNSGLGMWGVGIKVANVSFVDNLKHTLIGMYYGGTNEGKSWSNQRRPGAFAGDDNFSKGTLMTSDRAYEVDLINEYKVNENLAFRFDVGYVWLDLGDSWKDNGDTKGSFMSGIGVRYQF